MTLDAALEYLDGCLPVFPVCSPRADGKRCLEHADGKHDPDGVGKTALVAWKPYQTRLPTENEVRAWWAQWPQANIAFATGSLYGFVVVDLDGAAAVHEAQRLGWFDDGPWAITGRVGGQHRYCAYREDEPRNFARVQGIDYRGEGGYVILPPSRHRTGASYAWKVPLVALERPELPRWINDLKTEERRNGTAPVVGDVIADGSRNATLTSMAGTMRRRGFDESAIAAALLDTNRHRCRPPLDDAEVHQIAHSMTRYAPDTEQLSATTVADSALPTSEATEGAAWPEPENRGRAVLSALGELEYAEDLVRPGRIVVVAATEGSGKSFAIDSELGIRLAIAGGAFAETWPVLRQGGVLILSEMHPDDDFKREKAVLAALDLERSSLDGRYFRLDLSSAAREKPALDSAEWRTWIVDWCRKREIIVQIYDTATGATASNPWGQDIQAVFRNLRLMLTLYPALAIILIVHCKKPQGRGGREITDVIGEWGRWCDVVLMLESAGVDHVKLSSYKRVRRPRRFVATQRDGLLVDPKDLAGVGQTKVSLDKVAAIMAAEPLISSADLGKRVGVSKATAARYMRDVALDPRLTSQGRLTSDETGGETLVRRTVSRLTTYIGETGRETASCAACDGPSGGQILCPACEAAVEEEQP